MRIFFLYFFAVVLLAGCMTTNSQRTYESFTQQADAEFAGWQRVNEESAKNCRVKDYDKASMEEVLKAEDCFENLAKKHAYPVALDLEAAQKLVLEYRRIALDRKENKISKARANLRADELWNNYVYAINHKGEAAMSAAAEADRQQEKDFKEAMERASETVSKPTRTNCMKTIAGYNCTTY